MADWQKKWCWPPLQKSWWCNSHHNNRILHYYGITILHKTDDNLKTSYEMVLKKWFIQSEEKNFNNADKSGLQPGYFFVLWTTMHKPYTMLSTVVLGTKLCMFVVVSNNKDQEDEQRTNTKLRSLLLRYPPASLPTTNCSKLHIGWKNTFSLEAYRMTM